MKKPKPKRTAVADEMQWHNPDHRAYGLCDDNVFNAYGRKMLDYVRSDRPDGDKIAIVAQVVTVKDHTGKKQVQFQMVLMNAEEALAMKKFAQRRKLGQRPVPETAGVRASE